MNNCSTISLVVVGMVDIFILGSMVLSDNYLDGCKHLDLFWGGECNNILSLVIATTHYHQLLAFNGHFFNSLTCSYYQYGCAFYQYGCAAIYGCAASYGFATNDHTKFFEQEGSIFLLALLFVLTIWLRLLSIWLGCAASYELNLR
jgi:hypothetical protein